MVSYTAPRVVHHGFLTLEIRIEPILYRHIKLTNSLQADAFIRTLDSFPPESSPNHSLFLNSIKSISFTYGVTLHQAARILSTCKTITSLSTCIEFSQKTLGVSFDDIDDFRNFMMTPSTTLRRLSVTLHAFFHCPDPDFRVPIFRNLTHLSIFGASASEHCHKWSWTGLDTLEHLTHLALEFDTSTPLQAIYKLIPHFPPPLRACLLILSVKPALSPAVPAVPAAVTVEQFLVDNTEFQRLILGDVDRRIVVGTTTTTTPTTTGSDEPWQQQLIPVSKWDDTFGDREAWERVERVLDARSQKYKPC